MPQFVYEFKSTRNRFLFGYVRPVAQAQADLYAFFFRRRKRRVQVWIEEEASVETLEEITDFDMAKTVLAAFEAVDHGKPARPPKAWKCRRCDYLKECPIAKTQ
jgi:CRISPR/Cas system-associated exonuclease Cas4 (RecB family)